MPTTPLLTCLPPTGGPPLAVVVVGLLLTLAGAIVIVATTRRRGSALGPALVLLLVVLTGGLGLSARADATGCGAPPGGVLGPVDEGPVLPEPTTQPTTIAPTEAPPAAPSGSPTAPPTVSPPPTATPPAPSDVPSPTLPDLQVTVVPPPSPIASNYDGTATPVDFSVTVTNVGPAATTAPILGDLTLMMAGNYDVTHDAGTDAPAVLTPNSQGGFDFTHPGPLAPGASFTLHFQVVMNRGNFNDPSDVNARVLTGTGGGETNAANDHVLFAFVG